MRKQNLLLILNVSILFIFQFSSVSAADKVQVAASIPPQAYFVEQIGGELVEVITMLPEGGFPHTYEPTPNQMKLLSKANMYVRIKVEFENAWWEKIITANPGMYVIDSTEGADFIMEHEHATEDRAQGRNPHIWLSPRMVKIQAEAICEGLIHLDPENKEAYTTNKEAFLKVLDELDKDIQEMLAGLKTRKFMVFHPSWSYFAEIMTWNRFRLKSKAENRVRRKC